MPSRESTPTHQKAYAVLFTLMTSLALAFLALPAVSQPWIQDCATACTCQDSCSKACTPDGGFTITTCGAEGRLCNGNTHQCPDPCINATPPNSCPATTCPASLRGWSNYWGTCTNEDPHGCVEECQLWCNQTTLEFCVDTTNCAFQ